MSELQKTEKSVRKLLNKIESMISIDLPLNTSDETESEILLFNEEIKEENVSKNKIEQQNQKKEVDQRILLPLIPSDENINSFFDILKLRVTDISITLLKHRVVQYFYPSPLNQLVKDPKKKSNEISSISLLLNTIESDDILKLNKKQLDNYFNIIKKWDEWKVNNSSISILVINTTEEGKISQLNPEFIQELILEIFEIDQEFQLNELNLFLDENNIDSLSLLLIIYLYLYNSTSKMNETLPSHMEFIEWINLIIPHEISNENIIEEKVEEDTFKIKGITIPSEIYSFLLDCLNGNIFI